MKKKIYELTNEELEKYYSNPQIQELLEFVDNPDPCETLLDSYIACLKFERLLEMEIEVDLDE